MFFFGGLLKLSTDVSKEAETWLLLSQYYLVTSDFLDLRLGSFLPDSSDGNPWFAGVHRLFVDGKTSYVYYGRLISKFVFFCIKPSFI